MAGRKGKDLGTRYSEMEMDNEESKYERNLSKWESFLKPIKGEIFGPQETLGSKGTPSDCLSGEVARKLTKSTSKRPAHAGDVAQLTIEKLSLHPTGDGSTDQTAKQSPTEGLLRHSLTAQTTKQSPTAGLSFHSKTAQTPKRVSQNKPTNIPDDQSPIEEGSNTTDLSTSLSNWTLETFARYVDFTSVQPLTIKPFKIKKINSLYREIKGMFGDREFDGYKFDDQKFGDQRFGDHTYGGQTLESCITNESKARMAIDRLILEVCKFLGIQVKTEQEINFDYLPTGILDYYFLSAAEEPLGCLEAKSPKTLNKHAFVQAVMELLLVQELGVRSKPRKAFFCILSDGIRYVLMQVMGKKLYLEFDKNAMIKVRSFQNKEDFKDLITSICYLIEEAKKNPNPNPNPSGDQ